MGWGSLAGPVVSVAYVTEPQDMAFFPPGVTDSKKLTEASRGNLYLPLIYAARDIGLGYATAREIDVMSPAVALQLSYERALKDLHCVPDQLIMDGSNKVKYWKGKQIVEPKADFKYKQVSAASIVAKVFRDRLMKELHLRWPQYGWDHNAGYWCDDHVEGIEKYGMLCGPTDETYLHRKVYCRKIKCGLRAA